MPCAMRHMTSSGKLPDAPHRTVVIVNPAMLKVMKRRLPSFPDIHPVNGVAMATAMIWNVTTQAT